MKGTQVFSLDLLFRQHDVCWREPRVQDERRIFTFGNSIAYGFPFANKLTAIGLVNQNFELQGIPAHVFNLGFVFSYQIKEVMILSEALSYDPDFIVYGVSLNDLVHLAPISYPPLAKFFDSNSRVVTRLALDPPATFEEPFRRYRDMQAKDIRPRASWIEFREAGTFVRTAVSETAKTLRERIFPELVDQEPTIQKAPPPAPCKETTRKFNEHFANWKAWSMLDALAELRAETGVEVLVVNWPVNHELRGNCYNAHYPAASFRDYLDWMEEKAKDLGLPYLDLHDLLQRREFIDSLHPTARGQRKISERLTRKLADLLSGNDDR